MFSILKRYWWVGVCFWVLLAFVSWHYESTCGVFFASGCLSEYWEGIRWFALLKFVAPYQTLLGGFAAVVAGSFVLRSTRETLEEARRLKAIELDLAAAQQNSHLYKVLQLVSVEFYILSGKFRSQFLIANSSTIDCLNDVAQDIAEHDPELLAIARITETLINHQKSGAKGGDLPEHLMKQCCLLAYAAYNIFLQASDEDFEQDPPQRNSYFDPTEIKAFIKDNSMGTDQLLDLIQYFDWGNSDQQPITPPSPTTARPPHPS